MDTDNFWKDIVYKDGKLDEEQVMKELSDYRFVMQEVAKVYCHVTGGKLSKIMYKAETIIAEADDLFNKTFDENMKEYLDDACAEKDAQIASLTQAGKDCKEALKGHMIENHEYIKKLTDENASLQSTIKRVEGVLDSEREHELDGCPACEDMIEEALSICREIIKEEK